MARTEKPGIMLYFETLDSLSEYTDEETGLFLRAAGEYARYGVVPNFEDRGLRGLWKRMVRDLERDDEAFQRKCQKSRYSAYVSAAKRRYRQDHPGMGDPKEGKDYLCWEDWVEQVDEANACARLHSQTSASKQKPNTTPTLTPTPAPASTPAGASTSTTASTTGTHTPAEGNMGGGDDQPDVNILQAQFVKALAEGNRPRAGEISNTLFGLGYNIDSQTGELSRRCP